jgi:serine protease
MVACSEAATEINEDYIVVLKRPAQIGAQATMTQAMVASTVHALADKHRLHVRKIYSVAIKGGLYRMTADQAEALKREPSIAYVEKDQVISINAAQSNAVWGLDRLDQSALPLNQTYNYPGAGAQVNAYVIDTGVLVNHSDFEGRAVHGRDLVDGDGDATDCNGHGTHVAGTIGSKTYGVAKNVKIHAVRVLDCQGSGTFSGVIEGIEWVTANHVKPAVANMSLGGPISQAVDDAVKASIQAGVTYVLAAGNENTDACNGSPARVGPAITVGSSTKDDARSSFSNYGTCVDIFAPGSEIKSLWYTSVSSTNTISGTSMASPHVAGVAALYLNQNPNATPSQVATALVNAGVLGKISNAGSGSPNKLANIVFLLGDGGGGGDDDDDGGDGDTSTLRNNVPIANIAGARFSETHFSIVIPSGARNLIVNISGGRGDADLYVRQGQKPTITSYNCRPYRNGNIETCTIGVPQAGTYHVMLRGYTPYSGVSLKASYQAR